MISDDKISTDSDNKVDTAAVVRTMWSGRITIAISATVCTVLALAYALLATPLYRSEISVIEVSPNGNNGIGALASQIASLAGLVGVNFGTANAPGHETSDIFVAGLTRDDYIAKGGGTTQKTDRKRINVVGANGDVFSGKRSGWFSRSHTYEMHPGDTIVVPLDTERVRALPLWQAVTTIIYNLAVALLAVRSV